MNSKAFLQHSQSMYESLIGCMKIFILIKAGFSKITSKDLQTFISYELCYESLLLGHDGHKWKNGNCSKKRKILSRNWQHTKSCGREINEKISITIFLYVKIPEYWISIRMSSREFQAKFFYCKEFFNWNL